jgi:hypothetical protein
MQATRVPHIVSYVHQGLGSLRIAAALGQESAVVGDVRQAERVLEVREERFALAKHLVGEVTLTPDEPRAGNGERPRQMRRDRSLHPTSPTLSGNGCGP